MFTSVPACAGFLGVDFLLCEAWRFSEGLGFLELDESHHDWACVTF
jgi:hypothetical protein